MRFEIKRIYDKYFPYLFLTIFIALSITLITQHEFWFDEVRSWDLAHENSSLTEMFRITRVAEGTPSLWYVILYFISHYISDNIGIMKIVHLTISTITAFLILKYAPFNRFIRVMLIFGYFFFYEYSIISRNYALGVLLIVSFCVLYKNKYNNILSLGFILFFMGQANTLSFIISVCLFIILFTDIIKYFKSQKINKLYFFSFILIFLAEILVFVWQIVPQSGSDKFFSLSGNISNFLVTFSFPDFINQFSENIIKAFIPIPKITLEFWNSSLAVELMGKWVVAYKLIIPILLLIIPLFMIKKRLIFPYVFGLILIISGLFLYKNPIRLIGYIFILFIVCLWISNISEDEGFLLKVKTAWIKKAQDTFLCIVLIASIAASGIAFYYDYNYPFSQSKNVAEYIEKNFDLDNSVIIGIPNAPTETITGNLDKDFYYPQEHRFGRLVRWSDREKITVDSISEDLFKLKNENPGKNILVIKDKYGTLSSIISDDILFFYKFEKIKDFSNSIVPNESYRLYSLNNSLNFNLIEKMDLSSFGKDWKSLNNFEFEITEDNHVLIKPVNHDPNFENNFQIPIVDNKKKLYLKINIYTNDYCEFEIYYRKENSSYNENNKIIRNLVRGPNHLFIPIGNTDEVQAMRIDPVNVETVCIIESIEFYELKVSDD